MAKTREKSDPRGNFLDRNEAWADSAIVRNLDQKNLENLTYLQKLLANYDPEDQLGFAAIIRFVSQFGLPNEKLAKRCGVSPATVSRWANSIACPIKPARLTVISEILSWVDHVLIISKSDPQKNIATPKKGEVIALNQSRNKA